MRAIFPESEDGVDVHDVYAAGWVDEGGIRANFVAAVDGAAQAQGTSAGLQTPGDNQVFGVLRDLADVVLAGAGTAVSEGYRPATPSARRRAVRRAYGFDEQLPIAVTSRTLRLDPDAELFAGTDGPRTLVLTCAAAPAAQRARLGRHADVIDCGDDDVDPLLVRAALTERGLTRVLSEGGPTALAQLVHGGVLDELCLSVSPMLVGPGPGRITSGAQEWPVPTGMDLLSVLTEDGALFLRYRVGAVARGRPELP